MNQVIFECALRFLVLLDFSGRLMSEYELVAFDYISTFGRDFGIADYNLNGDNVYRDSEYYARRQIASEAIKMLVLRGFVNVDVADGFRYQISEKGASVADSVDGAYQATYTELTKKALKKYGEYSEKSIVQLIERFILEGRK